MASGRSEDYKAKILKWLMDEGWEVRNEPKIRPDYAWVLTANRGGLPPHLHYAFVKKTESLVMFSVFYLDDAAINEWTKLSGRERNDFMIELKLRLLARPYAFAIEEDKLKVTIEEKIQPDGFSKNELFKRLVIVQGGVLFAGLLCLQRLGLTEYGFEIEAPTVN